MSTKKQLPLLFILVLLFGIFVVYKLASKPVLIFKAETKVGTLDLSGKTIESGLTQIDNLFSKPIYLNLDSNSRSITLNEIGITYDKDKLLTHTVNCYFTFFPKLCLAIDKPSSQQNFIKTNTAKLSAYLAELEKEFDYYSTNTIISFEDYSFVVPTENTKVTLDKTVFENGNIVNEISSGNVKIKLQTQTDNNLLEQKAKTLTLIEQITHPLLIKYGRNPIYIPAETLNEFIEPTQENNVVKAYIKDEKILAYLSILDEKYASPDVVVVKQNAVDAIKSALLFRAANNAVNNAVVLPLEGKSKSDGKLHDTYLEVIKSQQRLYRFEKGKLVKTYIISTGLTWETPPGEYKIQGKQKMAISYFGNWYMPDYLPIGVINGGYKFGFHSIPYHIDGGGNIYSRDINTMGSPATGGCIQLKPDEALELFNWANIGVPVYIYE